jgi:hypothetical protein
MFVYMFVYMFMRMLHCMFVYIFKSPVHVDVNVHGHKQVHDM